VIFIYVRKAHGSHSMKERDSGVKRRPMRMKLERPSRWWCHGGRGGGAIDEAGKPTK
jgi:hypothetical protein